METEKAGPVIADEVAEVQAIFASEAAMHDAVAKLTSAGFDHADLSLPKATPTTAEGTPETGADAVITDTDTRQARTLGTSMAGTAGAFAAAGVTVATGGAAGLAIAAAAAAGLGSAALAGATGAVASSAQTEARAAAAQRGELVLSVRTTSADAAARAVAAMKEAGAEKIANVSRQAAGITSAGWTG